MCKCTQRTLNHLVSTSDTFNLNTRYIILSKRLIEFDLNHDKESKTVSATAGDLFL